MTLLQIYQPQLLQVPVIASPFRWTKGSLTATPASPCGKASVSRRECLRKPDRLHVGRLPHVYIDRLPQLQLFRNGPVDQAALLSSDSACPRQGPLAPRALPRFLATMGLSDSRRGRLPVIYSRPTLRPGPSPRRVSQVPRCDCPSAPSPSTPGCPAVAHARYFAAGSRLHHIGLAGHIQKHNEAEPGSLALGLTRSQSGRITSFAPHLSVETGPLPVVGYPDTGGRCYVMNKQLSRLTPFSQQVAPGFAWRSQRCKSWRASEPRRQG